MTDRAVIGDTPRRREDARFVTGRGAYLDDLRFDGLAHAVFVRSDHAHAILRRVDAMAARAAPGVIAVLTAAEVAADRLNPLHPTADTNAQTGEPLRFLPQPLLAREKLRYVGEPVALVIAETKHQAMDAAESVAVDADPLPCVVQADKALSPGAPLLSEAVPGNLCLDWRCGQAEDVDVTLRSAAHVVTIDVQNHRVVTNPMEPRGAIGVHDPASGRTTLFVSSQSIHTNRDAAARVLGVDPSMIRFVAPDVGGGFGAKNFPYAEHALILWAARRTGRAVKWIATRTETFLGDHQARDHQARATLALNGEGKFLALHVDSIANLGAYLVGSAGGVQTNQYVHLQGTVYDVPAVSLRVRAVMTNTTPIGVTRGPGFGEAANIMERLIDAAAAHCGFDRIALRRRNFVAATPMTNALNFVVDSGDFRRHFDAAVDAADLAGFPARRTRAERDGRRRGIGIVCHIKGTGGLPTENVDIRFEPDGTVSLIMGTQTIGQGHETTMPQIVADRLGIPNALITLKQGDTDLIPMGGGHGSSRATYMGGTAIHRAAEIIVAKGKPVAARALEAAEADIVFQDGQFRVAGTDRTIALLDVADLARQQNDPLDTYHRWTREAMTFPNGTHVAEVEVDPDTGRTTLERLTAVDDYGVLVNPMVASGQAHGAIAQGAGQALLEHARYDPDSGQPVASFMDYAMPRAGDLPSFDLRFSPTPCTTNPLGVKGCGEAGAIALFPAIGNAIADAVGVTGLSGAASPYRVWRALQRRG
ncbi:xanthine dehydrogenase family protein molybdopterin-binding subunit [Rhodopila sp.]|uniref:xanthine dehydrogenase family protein molybdopterin-binding subunit n=1 Tax=Rhodopila sp. TaxID=2480087 RepID=UPI002BD0178C|nr:xanthine dehydrogenase family protein molybdopterin-binding subunit [Rhodopila sp.]HVZ08358.1 xanthine dehydrogenase family protein molybdopterin-binding subunit [Rhodopila sp.]